MNIIDFIEIHAAYDKNSIAAINRENVLTYGELKQRSDALASYIIKKYGKDKTPIIVYGHKQNDMLVCFLACSKAGHAYVPVDISFPEDRIRNVVESSESKLIIGISELENKYYNVSMIDRKELIDIINKNSYDKPDKAFRVAGEDIYYILYTSGSTGKPKGVQITLNNLMSFLNWFSKRMNIEDDEAAVLMNQASYSFDLSVIGMYISLMLGKTLYAIDKDMLSDYNELFKFLNSSGMTTWISTPSFAEMCSIDKKFNKELLPKLKTMFFIGEVLTNKCAKTLFDRFEGIKIINSYGPTECTVAVTDVEITKEMAESDRPLPIGYMMEGMHYNIADDKGAKVKDGEKGELIIIGDSVSPGYYKNPEVTEKFFFKTNIDGKERRAYRTHDMVYEEKGLLYYCGRKDFQIKLNGFRIELEDIENNLRKVDIVKNTAVVPIYKDDKIQYLTAFVTLNTKSQESSFKVSKHIKDELKKLVPEYMVPRKVIFKDSFPVNANGKIDRKVLMGEVI